MKITKIFIAMALFFAAFLTSCVDEYEEPNEFSDVAWYTSMFRQSTFQIGVNDFISFSDLSHNAKTHKWIIPEGAFLLKGPINRNDTILENFIIEDAGLETEDKTIHVLFTKPGIQPVRFVNTFSDTVVFRGQDTLYSHLEGNLWVIDTTFMVDVYDTIAPQYMIRQDGIEIALSTDTIYIEAGTSLEFIDLTTQGRPDTRRWNVAGYTSSDSLATILFKRLGVWSGSFVLSRTGQNIPYDYKQVQIPNPFKVIPSSQPFMLVGDVVELEDETIQVPFNGEFAPFFGKEEFFTVMVNGIEFPIESVTTNEQDLTLLEITLVDSIYRPDVITVSMADGSEMFSTDERTPVPFSDAPVVMHDVNLLDEGTYGFEDGSSAGWEAMWDHTATFEITSERAASGNFSMKLSTTTDLLAKAQSTVKFSFEAGKTYTIRYKLYIEETTPGNSVGVWLLPNWNQFWVGVDGKAVGEWVTVEHEWTAAVDEPDRNFMVRISPAEAGTYYWDDFYIVEKEVRPVK